MDQTKISIIDALNEHLYEALDLALDACELQTCGRRSLAYVMTLTPHDDGPTVAKIDFVMTRQKGHGPDADCQCTASNDDLKEYSKAIEGRLTNECQRLIGPNATASFKLVEKD